MKIFIVLLATLIATTCARPTFDKIAEVLLDLVDENPHRHYPHPHPQPYPLTPGAGYHQAGYGQGYHEQYHYGGGGAEGYYQHGNHNLGGYPQTPISPHVGHVSVGGYSPTPNNGYYPNGPAYAGDYANNYQNPAYGSPYQAAGNGYAGYGGYGKQQTQHNYRPSAGYKGNGY